MLTEYHAANALATYMPALRAADQALAIDPQLAEAHTSLAYIRQFYQWDFAGAEREFRRAIQLNPRYPRRTSGSPNTSRRWAASTKRSRRFGWPNSSIRCRSSSTAARPTFSTWPGDTTRSIEQCRRVLDMDPHFPEVVDYLKRAYDQKRMYRESVQMRQRRRRILGLDDRETPALRAAAAATTPRAYWRRRLEQELIESRAEGLLPFEFAELLAQAGEHDRATEWLEKSCAQHDFMSMYIRVTPNLDPVRSDPRYLAILQRSCAVTTERPGGQTRSNDGCRLTNDD